MNGLIDYTMVTQDISEADARRLAEWAKDVDGNPVVARPMAGDPVTGKSCGNWEVVLVLRVSSSVEIATAPRLRKFPARAGHEEQLGEVLP